MLYFLWGSAIGISIGYPMGLWAIWHTRKEIEKKIG